MVFVFLKSFLILSGYSNHRNFIIKQNCLTNSGLPKNKIKIRNSAVSVTFMCTSSTTKLVSFELVRMQVFKNEIGLQNGIM